MHEQNHSFPIYDPFSWLICTHTYKLLTILLQAIQIPSNPMSSCTRHHDSSQDVSLPLHWPHPRILSLCRVCPDGPLCSIPSSHRSHRSQLHHASPHVSVTRRVLCMVVQNHSAGSTIWTTWGKRIVGGPISDELVCFVGVLLCCQTYSVSSVVASGDILEYIHGRRLKKNRKR